MKTIKAVLMGMGMTVITLACVAQEDEEAPERYTYASYFMCPGGPVSQADEIFAEDKGRLDKFVEDGVILSWGYLAHHTGGKWRRLFYYQANSVDALLDAGDAIQDTGDDEADDDGPTFSDICNIHDDYIWQVENGTITDGGARGTAGISVYHVCDITREDRADELVAEHVGPILNQFVEDGKLSSWGWSSHVVGGQYRKLQTMTAPDFKSLLAARGEAIEAIYGEDDAAGAEFAEICGPHTDYLWNIIHESQ